MAVLDFRDSFFLYYKCDLQKFKSLKSGLVIAGLLFIFHAWIILTIIQLNDLFCISRYFDAAGCFYFAHVLSTVAFFYHKRHGRFYLFRFLDAEHNSIN